MICQVGDEAQVSKTVSESDVYLFAGLTGDFYEAHVDQTAMEGTAFGGRIAHGALIVGFMSAAGTQLIHAMKRRGDRSTPVSLGYDGLRFVAPVRLGDTVRVTYREEDLDPARDRSNAQITVTNQTGDTVAVARHVMKWLRDDR